MEILRYTPEIARGLADLYNEVVVAAVPRCYPVDTKRFAGALGASCGQGEDRLIHSQAVFVALEGKTCCGFIHVAIGRNNKNESQEHGQIRFLCYRPADRLTGQLLLSEAESYLRRKGSSDAIAFLHEHRYSFYYRESACLSAHLGHIGALLGANGYRFFRSELMMEIMDYTPPTVSMPEPRPEVRISEKDSPGALPSFDIDLFFADQWSGGSECRSCAHFGTEEELDLWWLPNWFWIADEHQGKGLGRFLLRISLTHMYDIGYRHAAISTCSRNHRAALLYTSEGYRVIDPTCAYRREL